MRWRAKSLHWQKGRSIVDQDIENIKVQPNDLEKLKIFEKYMQVYALCYSLEYLVIDANQPWKPLEIFACMALLNDASFYQQKPPSARCTTPILVMQQVFAVSINWLTL